MSTRSHIGIVNTDGSITFVYCHWDGYPSHNGKLLLDHYNTEQKIRCLLAFGDISVLGKELGRKHDMNNFNATNKRREDGLDWCSFYGRDRNEEVNAKTVSSFEFFTQEWIKESWCEYFYLFFPDESKKGTWKYAPFYTKEGSNVKRLRFRKLTRTITNPKRRANV